MKTPLFVFCIDLVSTSTSTSTDCLMRGSCSQDNSRNYRKTRCMASCPAPPQPELKSYSRSLPRPRHVEIKKYSLCLHHLARYLINFRTPKQQRDNLLSMFRSSVLSEQLVKRGAMTSQSGWKGSEGSLIALVGGTRVSGVQSKLDDRLERNGWAWNPCMANSSDVREPRPHGLPDYTQNPK